MMQELKDQAIDFLKEEFDADLDYDLELEATFKNHPIKTSAVTALFSFELNDRNPIERFFVFVGDSMPMIYPQLDLTLDEMWAVHLGMEFFIEKGVTEDTDRKSPVFLSYLKMVATVFQEQLYILKPDSIKIEKIYRFEDQKHVVGHAIFDDKVYSWIVGDIPHFVYKKDLPPQITWALHMGRILLT
jgi:hypothetical protein